MDYLNLQTNKTNYNCMTPNLIAAVSLVSGNHYTLNICTHSFKTSLLNQKKKISFCFPGMQPAYYRQACFAKLKSVTEHQIPVFEIFNNNNNNNKKKKKKKKWRNKCMIKSHIKAELKR